MWATLKKYEIKATFWNESEPTEETGGLSKRTNSDTVDMFTLFMHGGKEYINVPEGRIAVNTYVFQISKKELEDNSFTIYEGRTFISYKDETYRVRTIYDYRDYYQIQLIECVCLRVIDAE